MMIRYTLLAVLAFFVLGSIPARASELDDRVARADAAAVAMLTRVEQGVNAVLNIEEVLKGELDRGEIRARFEGISPFEMPASGSRRVLLLMRSGGGVMTVDVGAGDMLTATLANIEAVVLAAERGRPAGGLPVAETVALPPRGDGDGSVPWLDYLIERRPSGGNADDSSERMTVVKVSGNDVADPDIEIEPGGAPPVASVEKPDEVPGVVVRRDDRTAPGVAPVPVPSVPSVPSVPPVVVVPPVPPVRPVPGVRAATRTIRWAPARRSAAKLGDLSARSEAAVAVLVGRVTSVEASGDAKIRATIAFEVDEALKGEFRSGEALRVAVPMPARGKPNWRPRRGRAVIFVDVDPKGALRFIDPLYGVEPLDGEEKTAALYEKLGRVGGVSRATPVKGRSEVADCLQAWQAAWNSKDIVATVACYSSRSAIAKAYRLGGAHRDSLRRTLRDFPDKLAVSVRRIVMSGRDRATVSVALVQSRGEMRRRVDVEMLLVKEGDAWRILREGF